MHVVCGGSPKPAQDELEILEYETLYTSGQYAPLAEVAEAKLAAPRIYKRFITLYARVCIVWRSPMTHSTDDASNLNRFYAELASKET